jgi:flagellar basal body-associated protein FliL
VIPNVVCRNSPLKEQAAVEIVLIIAAVVVAWAVAVLLIIRFFMGAKRIREMEEAAMERARKDNPGEWMGKEIA